MRMRRVTGKPFVCYCIRCERRLVAGDSEADKRPVFADLDGKPFVAYYCPPCASAINATALDSPTCEASECLS